jgi:hypothetical protein
VPPPLGPTDEANITAGQANVEVVFVGNQLRAHPVGAKVWERLPSFLPWRELTQGSNANPTSNSELVVLRGTRPRELDAVATWKVPSTDLDSALDAWMKRSNASWLEGAPVPTAVGKADSADRMFALLNAKHWLYLTPAPRPPKGQQWSEEDQLDADRKRIKKLASFKPPSANAPFAILFTMQTPGAFTKFALATALGNVKMQLVPSTAEKLVIRLDPLPAGEAKLRIDVWDDNVKDATADLSVVQSNWELAQTGAHLSLQVELPEMKFATNGRLIFAEARVTKEILEAALATAEAIAARQDAVNCVNSPAVP